MTAAELAAAEAAHVADVSADEMTAAELAAAEAAHVAEVSADEMTATELADAEAAHVAEVSAGEMSPVPVESEAPVEAVVKTVVAVVEAAAPDEDRTAPPVAIVVIRIGVAVTIVVAGPVIRPIVVIAAVRIAGRGAGDHSGRDGPPIITIAVNVAMSVSPNVVAVACVAMCDIPVHAMPVQAVRDPRVSSVPIMVSDGRRVCGRRRGREDKSGRAERDSRNSKSAKSHGNSLSCWAAQQRRGNTPLARERYATPQMKPPSQVGNGENYPSLGGTARPSGGVRKKGTGGEGASEQKGFLRSERFAPPNSGGALI